MEERAHLEHARQAAERRQREHPAEHVLLPVAVGEAVADRVLGAWVDEAAPPAEKQDPLEALQVDAALRRYDDEVLAQTVQQQRWRAADPCVLNCYCCDLDLNPCDLTMWDAIGSCWCCSWLSFVCGGCCWIEHFGII